MPTTAPVSLNPFAGDRFPFKSTDEWINALVKAVQKAYPHCERVRNDLGEVKYRDDDPPSLSDIDLYRFVAYAEPGTNEGHYVYLRFEHRRTGVTVTGLSCKTFQGLDEAIAIAGFITRTMFTWA